MERVSSILLPVGSMDLSQVIRLLPTEPLDLELAIHAQGYNQYVLLILPNLYLFSYLVSACACVYVFVCLFVYVFLCVVLKIHRRP